MSLYSNLLESAMLPSYNGIRGREYSRHRRFLEESQWWPPERLREFQWQELQRLLKHALETVPYYRQKYAAAGVSLADVRGWDDFARLPVLTRQEINAHGKELCSTTYPRPLLPNATGGSTGVPTRFFITMQSCDWREAATYRAYSWSGCRLGERTLYLWGAPIGEETAWEVNKTRMYHWFRGELVISTFRQNEKFWDDAWRRCAAFRPRFLVGYVSSLEQFVRYAQKRQLRLPQLRAVLGAAEPVHDDFRRQVQETFGVPVFNTYGCREFMSLAAECELHRGLHVNVENVVVETKRPSAEGPSEFLVTDLHNFGMPFIRYEIGDVGTLDFEPCPCRRGLPKIRAIEGRTLDLIRGKDGHLVPGLFFPHLFKDIVEVSEFQVEQKSLEHIVLSVVLARPMSDKSSALLRSELNKVFGDGTHLEIQEVKSIPLRASGKRRVTIGLGQ